ncbi:hypothetical protein GGR56DRAFT_696525 [Xylariaceae sp. FL0804]|nr:hypothetical protein GGR56DRAFT_696525 [Xylariaceae sp. FL0804]
MDDKNSSESSFQVALETCLSKYGPEDILHLQRCSLQDVFDSIARLERDRRASRNRNGTTRSVAVKARLMSLISFVDRYAAAVDCLTQGSTGGLVNPAALIWGLVRVLLEVVSSAATYFSSVLCLLESLGRTVSLYSAYEDLYPGQPRFQHALVRVYADIILVLGKARKMFRKGKYTMLVRCFKSNFETDFKEDLCSIGKHLSSLKDETTLAHRKGVHNFIRDVKHGQLDRGASRRQQSETNQASSSPPPHHKIQEWLQPLDCESRLSEIQALRHPGTGSWILEDKKYLGWKNGGQGQSPLLWVSGPPGVGKSVLSSLVVEDLQQSSSSSSSPSSWSSSRPPAPRRPLVAYFHCDAGREPARSPMRFYGSILSQVSAQLQLRGDGHNDNDNDDDGDGDGGGIAPCLTQARERAAKFGRSTLARADAPAQLLRDLARRAGDLVLVVDGLDELDECDDVVGSLLGICREGGSGEHHLRLALFSRDVVGIRKLLLARGDDAAAPRIRVSGADVERDIGLYVRQAAAALLPVGGGVGVGEEEEDEEEGQREARREIADEICRRADGMFLWARVVAQDLAAATSACEMRERLRSCPPGLSGIYGHFLANVARWPSPQRRRLARDVILWVCHARSSGASGGGGGGGGMTVADLELALSTRAEAAGRVAADRRPFRSVVTDICHPFITVSEDGRHVRPVHHSFREYILSGGGGGPDSTGLVVVPRPEADAEIALRCLQFLKSSSSSADDADARPARRDAAESGGFAQYAATAWCHHAARGQHSAELEAEVRAQFATRQGRQDWLYWMLFRCDEAFPFQKVFRLQQDLRDWCLAARGRDERASASSPLSSESSPPELPPELATDMSMDVLELMVGLDHTSSSSSSSSAFTPATQPGAASFSSSSSAPSPPRSFGISYFDKMMVVRDLARRLTQSRQLDAAVAALEARRMAQVRGRDPARLACLLNTLGLLYDQQGHAELALHTHQKALAIQQRAADAASSSSSSLSSSLSSLSSSSSGQYDNGGRGGDDNDDQHQHRHQHQPQPQPRSPEALWSLNEMGRMHRHLGNLERSLATHEAALRALTGSGGGGGGGGGGGSDTGTTDTSSPTPTSTLTLPDDHPELAWTLRTQATTLRKLGRPGDALPLQRRVLAARERALGPDHPHTLWSRGDVARCLAELPPSPSPPPFSPPPGPDSDPDGRQNQTQRKYREDANANANAEAALAEFTRARDGRVRTLGPRHPDTLWAQNDVGEALRRLGRRAEALNLQRAALNDQEAVLGTEHPHTRWTRAVVAELEREMVVGAGEGGGG